MIKVLVEILSDLQLGEFEVKLNHRRLLDTMLQIAGERKHLYRYHPHLPDCKSSMPQSEHQTTSSKGSGSGEQ